jgi:hypothetical protein
MTAIEIEKVRKLPRSEKLQMMETLWEDLSHSEAELESPGWHRQALEETERRVISKSETLVAWADAKQQLRAQVRGGIRIDYPKRRRLQSRAQAKKPSC